MSGPIVVHEDDSNAQMSHVPLKKRKLRSAVWNDFTKELREDGSDLATCNHCKKQFTGASRSGTTHLRNHLRSCVSFHRAKRKKLDVVRPLPLKLDENEKRDDGAIVLHEYDTSAHLSPNPRRRKLRSLVWNDFTKEQKEDGSSIAICNHCKKQFVDGSNVGTTHLRKHLGFCAYYQRANSGQLDVGQLLLKWGEKKNDETADLECLQFDQELSRQDLARMVILHEYPFSIVNHVGFRTFVINLQPQFKLMSRNSLKGDCMNMYEGKRLKLHEVLGKLSCRVNLSMDMWSSSGNAGYLWLSCHYVDDDWKLHKKLINFLHVESLHEGEDIGKVILEKLCEWNIDGKLFSIVLDDSSTNDMIVQELRQTVHQKSPLLLDGDVFHVHSCSYILNLIVHGGLELMQETINNIRDGVSFVKSSKARYERFETVSKQVGALQRSLVIDVPSRWDSTYLMIKTACEFQDAFSCLAESDSEYIYAPSVMDWDNVKAVNECLKAFYLMTERISDTNFPTANLCFNNICSIHLSLKTWCVSSNIFVASVAAKMVETFEKYWGETNMVLAAASILDPRYKMKSIEYFFKLIYTDGSEAEAKIENAGKGFRKIYNEYAAQLEKTSNSQHLRCNLGSSSDSNASDCGPSGVSETSCRNALADLRWGLDQFLQETSSSQPIKSDLDLYLEEAVYPSTKGGHEDFDILGWWKHNATKYPVLSAMARDILGIPVSIAASLESGFNGRERVLHHYQSSMDPMTIQGLMCTQDWLRGEIEASSLAGLVDGLATIYTAAGVDGDVLI